MRRRNTPRILKCSFCLVEVDVNAEEMDRRIITDSRGHVICEPCVAPMAAKVGADNVPCAFCRHRVGETLLLYGRLEKVVVGPAATICDVCLHICQEAFEEEVPPRAAPKT